MRQRLLPAQGPETLDVKLEKGRRKPTGLAAPF